MASGIANQKNSSDNLEFLDVICYDIADNSLTELEKIQALKDCGFIVPEYNETCLTYNEIISFIEKIRVERSTLKNQRLWGFHSA